VVEVDPSARIVSFEEKPAQPRNLSFRPDAALVSMGIYVFHTQVLLRELEEAHRRGRGRDFGRDIIPWMLKRGCGLYAYDAQQGEGAGFYWRDIGMIDAYWAASMELLEPVPPLDLSAPDWNFHTYQPVLPPARIQHTRDFPCHIANSLVCAGTHISGAWVERSILSPGVRVAPQAEVVE
jgi:glucose-1-phosphate adenylyltransferase